eukprot:CAMPEP_0185762644 /NCGR_PEP_ID=MMETSP1174-20130828/21605_1 /TAXON_ID=35687 /ORGANISM="Dictyocha speculum, Strain CCMP1381" /LENGTH=100 /DNA_ID=CAMNT_0028444395 /DNA_START=76 /DNA_END=378 /DNA_ORIENTATION=+
MRSIAVLTCLVITLTSSSAFVIDSSSVIQPRHGMVLTAKDPSGRAKKIRRGTEKPKDPSSGPVYDKFYDGVDEEKDNLSIAAAAVFFVGLIAIVQSIDSL